MNEQAPHGAPPPKRRSGGGWLVLALLAAAGGYAYTQGWLDGLLERATGLQQQAAAPPSPAPAQPQPAPAPAPAAETAGLISQLDALQTRVIRLETTARQLQSISEEFADQMIRQNFAAAPGAAAADIARLKLELIDLRLRVSGDPQAALAELNGLAGELPDDSSLMPLIEANRPRLASLASRPRILQWFGELDGQIEQARAEAGSALQAAAAPDPEATKILGVFSSLVKVSRDTSAELVQLEHVERLANQVPHAVNALLGGSADSYLESLGRLQDAAAALNNHNSTVVTSEITRTVSELISAGFPASFLLLESEIPAA